MFDEGKRIYKNYAPLGDHRNETKHRASCMKARLKRKRLKKHKK